MPRYTYCVSCERRFGAVNDNDPETTVDRSEDCSDAFCYDCCGEYHWNCNECGSHVTDEDHDCCSDPDDDPDEWQDRASNATASDNYALGRQHGSFQGIDGLWVCNHHRFHGLTDVRVPDKPHYVGLEIECTSTNGGADNPGLLNRFLYENGWGAVSDGSLPPTGIEFQTPPLPIGAKLTSQINEFYRLLTPHTPSFGTKAGLHCHVDARCFSWYDLRRLVLGWQLVAPIIRLGIPHWRYSESRYCAAWPVDWADTVRKHRLPKQSRLAMVQLLYSMDAWNRRQSLSNDPLHHHYHSARYVELNLCSWRQHGTVEFRFHHATPHPATVIQFATWCMDFVRRCYAVPESTLKRPTTHSVLPSEWSTWWGQRATALDGMPATMSRWVARLAAHPQLYAGLL